MNENNVDLTAVLEKPMEEWTLAECKAYCNAASDEGNCETADCLLCSFCQEYLKLAPHFWWEED